MTSRNLVSIISPNYNKGQYIEEMIQSVIQQSYNNWELLIVDDGSSDNSLDIINIYKESDPRIRVMRRERHPKGGSTCRNIGLKNALGDYIVFLDSDDLLAPCCLEQRVKQMNKNPSLDFGIFPIGTFVSTPGDSNREWRPNPNSNHLYGFLSHNLPWHTSSPIWKKHILEAVGGFNEKYPRLQDIELHAKILLLNPKYQIFTEAEVDMYYRIHAQRSQKIYNNFEYNSLFVKSTVLFIKDFSNRLIKASIQNKQAHINRLSGTLFSTIKRILTDSYCLHTLKPEEGKTLIYKLMNSNTIVNNIPKWKRIALGVYRKLFSLGAWRIKGFNFLSKKIIGA